MSGPIDPASHLNLDYPDHKATTCVIVEKFEVGAKAIFGITGLAFATVDPTSAFDHYGYVDYTQRLSDMIEAVNEARNLKKGIISTKVEQRGDKC
jgi:hypothetical protein